jgi:hypothetical protein
MKWIRVTNIENIPLREGRAVRIGAAEIAIFNLGDRCGARVFAEKSSPDERDEIRRLAGQLDGLYALLRPDADRERSYQVHRFHVRFHMRVAECTGCDELREAVEKNQVLVFNWLYDTALGNQPPPPGWHSQLAEALAAGDVEAADAAMRRHTRYRMDEVLQRMEPYFGWTETRLATFPKRPRRKTVAADTADGNE